MGPGSRSLYSLVRDDEIDSIFKQPILRPPSLRAQAKQSMGPRKGKNGLLRRVAPRNDVAPPRSRGTMRPSFAKTVSPLLTIEGAGNAGRSMHPQPRVQMKKVHEHSHHGHTGNHPAFPAQWFYGLLRALPGDQACLTPSPALLLAGLTPALGRQNDTTWPYASASFVRLAIARLTLPRPPHPCPTSVTIAKRPSIGPGREAICI
jgi:hypothetical protein